MPRLVGKKPNYALTTLPIVFLAIAGAAAIKMEYIGVIDVVPEFGRVRVQN